MDKFKIYLVVVVVGALLLSISVLVLWYFALQWDAEILATWAVLATFLPPIAFVIGYWAGRSRGDAVAAKSEGVMEGLDKGIGALAKAVDLRDQSTKSMREHAVVTRQADRAAQQPPIVIDAGSLPPLRVITSGDVSDADIVEL